jgi:signal peptidase I
MIEDDLSAEADAAPQDQDVQARDAEPPSRRHRRRRMYTEIAIGVLVALILALGVRAFAFQVFFVPSSSMEPTLQIGDRILVDKLFFDAHSLHAGAIIVFKTPKAAMNRCSTNDGDLVKRVVATAGQTIESRNGVVYVDNKALPQPYLPRGTPLGQSIPPTKVPKNDVYVLGDNRPISCDSRVWGFVPDKSIIGTVVAIVWRSWHPDLHVF